LRHCPAAESPRIPRFTGFDARSAARSGVSLSLGVGYIEQSGRIDSDSKLPSLSNASQFDLVGGRR